MKNAPIWFMRAAMYFALVSQFSLGQLLPVPEYFGVYVVVDGKLLKLDGQEVHAEKFVTVPLGQRMGVGNVVQRQPAAMPPKSVQVPELPSDLKIVIYAQSGGMQSPAEIAKTLHLESLVFVRTLTIDTGSGIKRSDPEKGWDAGDAVELAVMAGGGHARELEFLTKPMPGQKDMVIAGLADKLEPGVYRLTLGQREFFMPASLQGGMLFGVQPVSQGEVGKCVDALMTYAISMSNTKYTECGGAVNAIAPSLSSATAGAETSATDGSGVTGIAPPPQVGPARGFAVLSAPKLLSPADQAVFDNFPRETTVVWSEVPGANAYTVEWDFKQNQTWSSEMRYGRPTTKIQVDSPVAKFFFVGAQTGRWRVWGVDRNGMPGAKSEWREFRYTK